MISKRRVFQVQALVAALMISTGLLFVPGERGLILAAAIMYILVLAGTPAWE